MRGNAELRGDPQSASVGHVRDDTRHVHIELGVERVDLSKPDAVGLALADGSVVEAALAGGQTKRTLPYLETLAGDTTIGHATAYAQFITGHLGLTPKLSYSGGDRGWIGDNPFIFLDTAKIRATGWQPKLTIEQGIVRTLQWLQQNQWILARR